ncbi:uncharacterized protein LOC108950565 [Ciona intestinalis]
MTFYNVTTHFANHHKDKSKSFLLYDSKLKSEKKGQYENYKGFTCSICQFTVKSLKQHCLKRHPDIDVKSVAFKKMKESCDTEGIKYNSILDDYEAKLQTMGVGKRNPVTAGKSKTYRKQVEIMIPNKEDIENPEGVYQRLEQNLTGSGKDGTKYAYLATIKIFLQFVDVEHSSFVPESVGKLIKYVDSWLMRQRSKKEKRQQFVKQLSRKKLTGLPLPFKAVQEYEKIHLQEISELRKKKLLNPTKIDLERVCGDIFVRIICRVGCRSSVLTGLTCQELKTAEKTNQGNYSIYIKNQKEKRDYACIVISENEFIDLQCASKMVWNYKQQSAESGDNAFPSFLNGNEKMDSSEFDKVWNKTIKKVFIGKSVNVTDVRKLITSFVSKQPKDVQLAIARAEGHSLQMAEKVYDISHPHELVEKGRNILEKLATESKDVLSETSDIREDGDETADDMRRLVSTD